ncbi:hypothetical protein SORBI_3003G257800 [Sorghum bicolor]|uniref:Uncharacterized protein n=1 Tax=Sorghum bicolor TaxID=4558 RepID=A0A1B6Q5B5_SORBI|nr:hypothetical protein SORBI_3003G257800 [Sorghum bicolor]
MGGSESVRHQLKSLGFLRSQDSGLRLASKHSSSSRPGPKLEIHSFLGYRASVRTSLVLAAKEKEQRAAS